MGHNNMLVTLMNSSTSLPDAEQERQWDVLVAIEKSRAALDAEPLIDRLDHDAVYESQNVWEPIEGKDAIADHLRQRFAFFASIRDNRDIGGFVPATVDLPQGADHPCLVFVAAGERQAIWTVRLTPTGRISRIDILTTLPHPREARLVKRG